jgi:hypothetical protein
MFYAHWLLHELCWWWIVSVFLAILFRFIVDSRLIGDLYRLATRKPAVLKAR